MTKTLSRIRVDVKGVVRHDITPDHKTLYRSRKEATDVAARARAEGFDVKVIEFYADGSRFEFDIA